MKLIKILLIEDNEGDILLTREALQDSKITNTVNVIRDGEAAIAFFSNFVNKDELPDLILLDINLPKKSGHEVLVYLKNSEKYKHIPVIILTTSSSERDITLSYKNYANCFITKPMDVTEFIDVIIKIEEFWFNIVTIGKR
ncbi:MAG: rcp [Mucilaginibacter sp.]|jgi:CheY-like chemotaxis protein|nr:rcp [Mucilaginibacter sp.]